MGSLHLDFTSPRVETCRLDDPARLRQRSGSLVTSTAQRGRSDAVAAGRGRRKFEGRNVKFENRPVRLYTSSFSLRASPTLSRA